MKGEKKMFEKMKENEIYQIKTVNGLKMVSLIGYVYNSECTGCNKEGKEDSNFSYRFKPYNDNEMLIQNFMNTSVRKIFIEEVESSSHMLEDLDEKGIEELLKDLNPICLPCHKINSSTLDGCYVDCK